MIRGRNSRIGKRLEDSRVKLMRLAWSWTGKRELAEDLVQECFARALKNIDSLRDEARLEVWTTQILANLFRDHCRRVRPEIADADPDEILLSNSTPESRAEKAEMKAQLESALGQLKPETRQVITLVDIAGFSYAECAEILDVPTGTIMSRISRGRERLLTQVRRNSRSDQKVVSLRRKM